jgi:hypothetical protein
MATPLIIVPSCHIHLFKRWQPRYFEIAGHYLKYAKDEKSLSNHPGNVKASFDLNGLNRWVPLEQ